MRKVYALMMVVLCATILSGCMRFSASVKVKSNGKADVSMLYAVSKELAEMGDEDINMAFSDDQVADMEADGWECKEYIVDNYVGYEMEKKNVDLNDLSQSLKNSDEESSLNTDQIKVQKKGWTYIIDWKIFEDDQREQMSAYKNYFNMAGGYMDFTLELPVKAINSNATSVSDDGKTLKWDLLSVPPEGIHVEFSLFSIPLLISCIIVGIILLIIIIVLIVVLSSRKKQTVSVQQPMGYSGTSPVGQGGYMGQQAPAQGQFIQNQNPSMQPNNTFAQQNQVMQSENSYAQSQNQAVQSESPFAQPQNPSVSTQTTSVADEIMKLKNLMESGIITEEEFEAQKKKLLEG